MLKNLGWALSYVYGFFYVLVRNDGFYDKQRILNLLACLK